MSVRVDGRGPPDAGVHAAQRRAAEVHTRVHRRHTGGRNRVCSVLHQQEEVIQGGSLSYIYTRF